MNDRELLQLLPDYVADRVDPQLRRLIEERCAVSEEMRGALEAARRYADALGAIEEVRAPDDFLDKVHQRIEQPSGMVHRLFTPLRRWLPVELAGVLVTALLVLFLFNPFSGEIPQLRTSRPVQEYESRQQQLPEPPTALPEEQPRSNTATKPEKKRLPKSEQPSPSHLKEQPAARARMEKTSPSAAKKSVRKKIAGASATYATENVHEYKSSAKQRTQSFDAASEVTSGAEGVAQYHRNEAPALAPSTPELGKTNLDNVSAEHAEPAASPPPAPSAAVAEKKRVPEKKAAPVSTESSVRPPSAMKRKMSAPRRSVAGAFNEERSLEAEAAPFADEYYSEHEPTELLTTTRKAVQRYRGSIDTIITSNAEMVSLRITLPSGKLDGFYKRLSRSCAVTITDTLSESENGFISVVLEVYE